MSTATQSAQLSLWNEQWIPVSTAARILRTSRGTVMRLLEQGSIRGCQITGTNGWWSISYESVLELQSSIEKKYGHSSFK